MPDKLVNITQFGTIQTQELGLELDDQRGRQDNVIVNKLFPQSAGGGGQSPQVAIVNRYRPGNRYKYVRLNATVLQYDAVQYDITFTDENQRDSNVVLVPNTPGIPMLGIAEFGNGGPLTTDPALTSHPTGTFGFITVKGRAIANVNAAVVAGDFLASGGGVGRLGVIAAEGGAHVQAVAQGVQAAAFGVGARALTAEPATGFKANLALIFLI